MIPNKIENIPLCQAISEFLEMLENKGCIIVDKKSVIIIFMNYLSKLVVKKWKVFLIIMLK